MPISQIGSTNGNTAAASTGQTGSLTQNALDKQAFLELLVTQLRHQDPMDPLKQEEYAAQLAQFSSVEQLTNLNNKFDQMYQSNIQLSRSISNTMAATIVGKEIQAVGDSISYHAGEDTTIRFNLANAARNVTLTIRDADDRVVKTIDLGSMHDGEQVYKWDGRFNLLGHADDGETFSYSIDATDREGNTVDATTFTQGRIDAVEYGNGGQLYFLLGDLRIAAGNVHRIYDGS